LQEDFSNPESGWEYSSSCYGYRSPGYKNGEMVLLAASCYNAAIARPHLRFDDFILEYDGRWSGGSVGGIYGVRFRHDNGRDFYEFHIGNDGRYQFSKMVDGDMYVLLEDFSDAIDRTGNVNRFHIEAKDHDFRFFMNGYFLADVHDVEHDLGEIILIANTPGDDFEVSFDNVVITQHP